jgi:ABC-type arginine transport system permease subunit
MLGVGIPLLLVGIIFIGFGLSSFMGSFSEGLIHEASGAITYLAIGGFLTVIGFMFLGWGLLRPLSKYYATEASPALKTASQSIGEGLRESGFGLSQQKEVIRIKCPNCGFLESEDAEFCSKCAHKL